MIEGAYSTIQWLFCINHVAGILAYRGCNYIWVSADKGWAPRLSPIGGEKEYSRPCGIRPMQKAGIAIDRWLNGYYNSMTCSGTNGIESVRLFKIKDQGQVRHCRT